MPKYDAEYQRIWRMAHPDYYREWKSKRPGYISPGAARNALNSKRKKWSNIFRRMILRMLVSHITSLPQLPVRPSPPKVYVDDVTGKVFVGPKGRKILYQLNRRRSDPEFRKRNIQRAKEWKVKNPERVRLIEMKSRARFREKKLASDPIKAARAEHLQRLRDDPWYRLGVNRDIYRRKPRRPMSEREKMRRRERLRSDPAFRAKERERQRIKKLRKRKNNPSYRLKIKYRWHKRRCRKKSLPYIWSHAHWMFAVKEWNGSCAYCGSPHPSMHQDHFIPLAAQNCPGTVPWNMVPACPDCNCDKSSQHPLEWLKDKDAYVRVATWLAKQKPRQEHGKDSEEQLMLV